MARTTRIVLSCAVILASTTACFFGDDEESADDKASTAAAAAGEDKGGEPPKVEEPWRTVDDPPLVVEDFTASTERNVLNRGTRALKVGFKAKAKKKSDESRTIRLKATCKFGDELLVATTSLMGSLDLKELEPGQSKKLDSRLFGMRGFEEDPDACEINATVGAIIDTKKPVLISQQCVQGEEVSEGPCGADVIERAEPKADGPLMTAYDLSAENDTLGYGAKKKKHLTVQFKARANRQIEDGGMLDVKSECKGGDETLVDTSSALGTLSNLFPGEAVQMRVLPFSQEGLDAEPDQCTFTVRHKVVFGDTTELGKFCWDGEKVSDGAC